jgi:hypothetical protein
MELACRGRVSNGFLKCAGLVQVEPPSLKFMNLAKISILTCAVVMKASLSLHAGTSPQEKAFTDKYKSAFEGRDTPALESFLYTQGADPAILGFYKMMQLGEAGEVYFRSSPKSVPTVRCSVGGSRELTKFRNRSEKTSGRSFQ